MYNNSRRAISTSGATAKNELKNEKEAYQSSP